MENLESMANVYNGLSGIFIFFWPRFPEKDYERFMKVSNYLNDVLNVNIYDYPEDKINQVYQKGTSILKKLLKRHGVEESSFSPEFLETMAAFSYEHGKELFENMDPEMKRNVEDLAKRKFVLGRLVKDKNVINENYV